MESNHRDGPASKTTNVMSTCIQLMVLKNIFSYSQVLC